MAFNNTNDTLITTNIIEHKEKEEISTPLSTITTTVITNGCNFQQPELGTATGLINLVKTYPELYDKTHQLYCNNVHKGVLWNKIADELGGTTAKKTREQFSYMRKRFRNEYEARKKGIQKALVPEPEATNYRQPLFVYEQLSFLEKVFEKELEAAQEIENNEEKESSATTVIENGLINTKDYTAAVAEKLSSKGSSPRKRRRTQNSAGTPQSSSSSGIEASSSSQSSASSTTVTSINNYDSSLLSILNNINSQPNQCNPVPAAATIIEDEECKIFGRQVAMDLQRLDQHTRMIVRFKISKILLELYLKQCEIQEN
uniref:MADF domain-containing protein n=1 Tax=Panagrolaimus sp. ES5 TaxID=591445 RepID=A0AC34FMA0_9BILA